MLRNVKITTEKKILDLLFPNRCQRCGLLGDNLCECCKKYILGQADSFLTNKMDGKMKLYIYSVKEGCLSKMVQEYKYKSKKELGLIFAEMLVSRFFKVLQNAVIVPLPTNSRHARERGFLHMELLAELVRAEIKTRGGAAEVEDFVLRMTDTVQVGASSRVRKQQAKKAYMIDKKRFLETLKSGREIILLDDVTTTGASLQAVADQLFELGVKKISGMVILANNIPDNAEKWLG